MANTPTGDPAPGGDLVTVLRTADRPAIAVARSLLEAEGIRCHVKGEGLRDVTGLAHPTVPFDPDSGAVELQVRQQDAEEARALLDAVPGDAFGDIPQA